jgi:hypothetical protein
MTDPATKRCNTCGHVKPLAEFVKRQSSSDGHAGWCRECAAAYHRQWRIANPGVAYENTRRWQEAHPEKAREVMRQWWENNPGAGREYDRARAERARKQVFAHYGEQCACCGTTKRLTIDHVNGDGAEHRRELFGDPKQNHGFYRWLVRNGFPAGFQTLCFPCNRSKGKGERCMLQH